MPAQCLESDSPAAASRSNVLAESGDREHLPVAVPRVAQSTGAEQQHVTGSDDSSATTVGELSSGIPVVWPARTGPGQPPMPGDDERAVDARH
jgi:hypothetical protein